MLLFLINGSKYLVYNFVVFKNVFGAGGERESDFMGLSDFPDAHRFGPTSTE